MPEVTVLPLQALAFLIAFLLPGAAWTWHHDPNRPIEVRLAVGAVVGFLVVPMVSFCAAWVLGTSVRPALVLAVAVALAGPAVALALLRRRGSR
jgi:predicted membrane protein